MKRFFNKSLVFSRCYNVKTDILKALETITSVEKKIELQNKLGMKYMEESNVKEAKHYFELSSSLLDENVGPKLVYDTEMNMLKTLQICKEFNKSRELFDTIVQFLTQNAPQLLLLAHVEYAKFLISVNPSESKVIIDKGMDHLNNFRKKALEMQTVSHESQKRVFLQKLDEIGKEFDMFRQNIDHPIPVENQETRLESKKEKLKDLSSGKRRDLVPETAKLLQKFIKETSKDKDQTEVLQHATDLFKIIPLMENKDEKFQSLFAACQVFVRNNQDEKSQEIYQLLCEMESSFEEKVGFCKELGRIAFASSNYNGALLFFSDALKFAKESKQIGCINEIYSIMGYLLLFTREWDYSQQSYNKDTSFDEVGRNLGIATAQICKKYEKKDLVDTLLNAVHASSFDVDQATRLLNGLIDSHPDSDIAVLCLIRLSILALMQKKVDAPFEPILKNINGLINKAHKIIQNWNDQDAKLIQYYNITMKHLCNVYALKHDWSRCGQICFQMLEFDLDPEMKAKWLLERGIVYFHLVRYNEAIRDITESLNYIGDKESMILFLLKGWYFLGRTYADLKNEKNAKLYMDKARSIVISDASIEKSLEFLPYHTEMKEHLVKAK